MEPTNNGKLWITLDSFCEFHVESPCRPRLLNAFNNYDFTLKEHSRSDQQMVDKPMFRSAISFFSSEFPQYIEDLDISALLEKHHRILYLHDQFFNLRPCSKDEQPSTPRRFPSTRGKQRRSAKPLPSPGF